MLLFVAVADLWGSQITLHKRNATVWGRDQVIEGTLSTPFVNKGTLLLNGVPQTFDIEPTDGTFRVPFRLGEGVNTIIIEADSAGMTVTSQTLRLTLGYRLKPEMFAWATVGGRTITLHSAVVENPDSSALTYVWSTDPDNPGSVEMGLTQDSTVLLTLDEGVPFGEYYFDLNVTESDGDVGKARTFVTVDASGIHPFNIHTDHAEWIDRAIIYEITPCDFVQNGTLQDIIDKIPDLVDLGISTIWLQPIFGTDDVGGHGYLITDYFNVRNEVGTKEDLRDLVETAHAWDLRVLLDFVPNHTSIMHPYARHSVEHDTLSHYYDYYQRDASSDPNVPYSDYYRESQGFVNYFWDWLPNLNYDNPEVQGWMKEACCYWVEAFDIDGYRFDAVWGVNARKPEFTRDLRLALKRIKPDVFMLAEDKATWDRVFEERFDAAFDWSWDPSWISKWAWWATNYYFDWQEDRNPTFFNLYSTVRKKFIRDILSNKGAGYPANAKILRFLENNDQHRFIRHHGVDVTKMAACLMFTFKGIPLIFNGQEIGFSEHPFLTSSIFDRYRSIASHDESGLYTYYKQLTRIRTMCSSLSSDNYHEIEVEPDLHILGFHRWDDREHTFVVVNLKGTPFTTQIRIPVEALNAHPGTEYFLSDLMNGDILSGTIDELDTLEVFMEPYQTRVFLFADSMNTTGVREELAHGIPRDFELEQNYPNPFNVQTFVRFTLPHEGKVRLVIYDILGREIVTLIDEFLPRGSHSERFDASAYPSGVYVYRLELGGDAYMKKMMLVK